MTGASESTSAVSIRLSSVELGRSRQKENVGLLANFRAAAPGRPQTSANGCGTLREYSRARPLKAGQAWHLVYPNANEPFEKRAVAVRAASAVVLIVAAGTIHTATSPLDKRNWDVERYAAMDR